MKQPLFLARRPDKANRTTLLVWNVQGDKRVKPNHLAVYCALASQAFNGTNIVKLGLRWIAGNARVNKDTAGQCLMDLMEWGHLEMVARGSGRCTVYKITATQFAPKQILVSDGNGIHDVARENIEAFRKRIKKSESKSAIS